MTAAEVRERLVEALELDLVGPGPGPGHALARERLRGWERLGAAVELVPRLPRAQR